jgi:alpha/beta hydrolase family protein
MAVTSLEITHRSVVLDGQPFGSAGAYEKIVGLLHFGVDPDHPANQAVTDLALAPRNGVGLVESTADFYLLRPVDPARGTRRLLLDIPNRGRKVALGMFNSTIRVPDPTTAEDFGNGFLMRHGYTVAWCGWQHDVPRQDGLLALTVPTARGENGSISGPVLCEWRPNSRVPSLPMADRHHIAQPTADLADPAARLTVRAHAGAPATAIARSTWRFGDATHVALDGGFEPGKIYELVYRAENPPLVGLGLLSVRDTAAWLRWGSADGGNPCAGQVERAYTIGVSQTGRFLRHLLYLGLNEDEIGRKVFDGVFVHIAGARRGEFNQRFGQPSLNATSSVGSLFPFTDTAAIDPVTGERGAQLARLEARGTLPKIVAVNTSAEYWRGDASLIHADVEGTRDVQAHSETRLYLFAGCQHTPGALPPPDADPNTGSRGLQTFNMVDYSPLVRAVLTNLDRWVGGVEPPPSAVPRLADGTGVRAESLREHFTRIPGVRFPDRIERPRRLDFGPDIGRGVVHELPPKIGAPFVTFVPSVDEDGNDIPGIRAVELGASLATFTGWNPRHPDQGAPGDLMSMLGSTVPFAGTKAAREASADPRPSIEERYPSRAAYLARAREAAVRLVAERHMLAEDVDAAVERAGRLWDFIVRA